MTNPPSVPSLDVEACVRLLLEEARYPRHRFFCNPRSAWTAGEQLMCDCGANVLADTLRALASALPGMGKAMEENERLRADEREATATLKDVNAALERMIRQCADAARAAQPEETSADAT